MPVVPAPEHPGGRTATANSQIPTFSLLAPGFEIKVGPQPDWSRSDVGAQPPPWAALLVNLLAPWSVLPLAPAPLQGLLRKPAICSHQLQSRLNCCGLRSQRDAGAWGPKLLREARMFPSQVTAWAEVRGTSCAHPA